MTATNETDHGCSCGRPDCRYDEKYGNPLRAVAPNTLLSAEQIVALDRLTHLIASELARIDGFDPDDQHGGLYDLRWQGGSMPEPLGDAWSMDYLPKAERIAHAAVAAMAEREAALVREVEELRADADRWRAIDWRWEDERDMGPGGRWVAVVWVNKGRPSVNAAIDAARAEARNG